MPFSTKSQATAELETWLAPLKEALAKLNITFVAKQLDLQYYGKIAEETFILELPEGVLLIGQPIEETSDKTVDERYSPRLIVTEMELKRGRIGIGHRQSYGARQNGLPQLRSVIECAQKRMGLVPPQATKDRKAKNFIQEMVVDPQPLGFLVHIGSVLVSEQCARAISDLIRNDELYGKSH